MNKPKKDEINQYYAQYCHYRKFGKLDCKISGFQDGKPLILPINADLDYEQVVEWEDIRIFRYVESRKFINKF